MISCGTLQNNYDVTRDKKSTAEYHEIISTGQKTTKNWKKSTNKDYYSNSIALGMGKLLINKYK